MNEDPRQHTRHLRGQFNELIQHLRQDVDKVDDVKARVLFETSAEVLDGLVKAFDHYESGSEAAMR